jgi:glucosyl-3-phosphoglycerate synthase
MPGPPPRRRAQASKDRVSPDWAPAARAVPAASDERSAARRFHHCDYPAARIADARAARGLSVSVCLPARECAQTVGGIVAALRELRETRAIDEIVVVDAASADGTAALAKRAGAVVWQEAELMPSFGPVLGKGDAMWRALSVLRGEIVCFLDADSEEFGAHFACGMIGPLVRRPQTAFVKGFYRRPFRLGAVTLPEGGGRVTELTARPLINLFYPDLAAVEQPLAGEMAARRELLEQLPFVTGYGVDIALLIDAHERAGLDAIAQVDLEVRQNAHQALRDLSPMAYAVLQAVSARLEREGRLRGPLPSSFLALDAAELTTVAAELVERPPLAGLRAAA